MKRHISNESQDDRSAFLAEYQAPYNTNSHRFSFKRAENIRGPLLVMERSRARRIGAMKGKFIVSDDFDAPLPDDLLDAFEGRHL